MWRWFTGGASSSLIVGPNAEETKSSMFTCTDAVELVTKCTDAPQMELLLHVTRAHAVERMSRDVVLDLVQHYKNGTIALRPEPCTPRQLIELLYLYKSMQCPHTQNSLFACFLKFASTVELNKLSFIEIMTNFMLFEQQASQSTPLCDTSNADGVKLQ